MKNIVFKFLLAAIIFLFIDTGILAQSNDTAETVVDTALTKSIPEEDSLQDYKKDRDFAYMKYLDSLLRKTKGISSDTFDISNANVGKHRNNTPPQSSHSFNLFNQPIIKIILWVLAILFIGFIMYKIFAGENFFKKNRTYKIISDTKPEEENIADASAYDKLIADAVSNKNFRLAVRYHYLQTLQKLSDAGILQLSADKTNFEYIRELGSKSYKNDFASATLSYEYVWYGKFEISEENYNKILNDFKLLNQKI